jgi:hypothetical protein
VANPSPTPDVVDFVQPGSAARSRKTWKFWTALGAGSVAALTAAVALVWLAVTILVLPSGGTSPTSTQGLVSWSSPEKIGPYTLDDNPPQMAEDLRQALLDRGLVGGVAATYDNWSNGFKVVVWGAGGAMVRQSDSRRELNALFSDIAELYGADGVVTSRAPISPGAVGGVAECGHIGLPNPTNPIKNVMECGWLRDGAMVGLYLTGYTPDRAGEIVPAVLAAVVHVP